VTDLPIFEYFRDVAFKSILSSAFKFFPKTVEQILTNEGWQKFTDFMAAVERSGRVLLQFEGKPRAKTVKKYGQDAALSEMLGIANTDAMNQLLSGAFYGKQGGEVDRGLSRAALFNFGITTWHTLSLAVMETALLGYSEATGGKTPMDVASPDTLLFHGLRENPPEEVMAKVSKVFGLPTRGHLIVLSEVVWSGDLTLEELDIAIGNPELLTEMVNRCPSNPRKGIVFSAIDNPPRSGYAGA
jgi:hypothetical protein